jgi:uncharacterized protein (DUF488 family)
MSPKLCTIGFAGKSAEEFFRLLESAGVRTVIDVRENRIGQLSGYAKFPDIAFFLERVAGVAYRYEPLLAPTPEIRKRYRETKDWPGYEKSFLELMRARGFPASHSLNGEESVAFLCSEPDAECCHRRLVAELLAARWREQGVVAEIVHLAVAKSPAGGKRKRRADDGADPE